MIDDDAFYTVGYCKFTILWLVHSAGGIVDREGAEVQVEVVEGAPADITRDQAVLVLNPDPHRFLLLADVLVLPPDHDHLGDASSVLPLHSIKDVPAFLFVCL